MSYYVKCAEETCNTKIPAIKVAEWEGKCFRCRGVEPNYAAPVGKKAPYVKPVPKGYVLCATEGCKVQLHEQYVAQDPANVVCPRCRNISYSNKK